nr:uncharacterized protein LOC128679817 [Plodia interpunctella]
MVSKVARQQWGIGRGLGKTCVCGVMKWYVIVWLVTARLSGGSVLRCTSDSKDASCISENQDKVTELKKEDLPSGKDCAPSTAWKTECNSCYCRNGHVFCTLVYCENEKYLSCAPGSRWKNDCNICQCSPDGQPVCTKMDCVPQSDLDVLDPVNFEPEVPEKVPDKNENVSVQNNRVDMGHKIHKRSVCKPNHEFQSECNTCKCSEDGLNYSCTQNECLDRDVTKDVEVFMESEGVDHINHSVCKPRDTFPIGCNTCHCNLNGTDYSCTNKPCPLPDDVEFFHEPKTTSSKNKTVVCEANRSFKKDCNTCWCNEDGTSFFCTRRACVPLLPDEAQDDKPEELRIIKKECRPNEVFELDCNMCRCNPDGKSFSCTRRACLEGLDDLKINTSATLVRKVRASQEPQKTCQPGTEFRLDCNKCLCDNEGQDFSCTRIDCNALNNNGNGGGRTKREEAKREATELAPRSAGPAPGTAAVDTNFRCNPGEQYSHDCNDCTCSADGKSTFCTLRLCDKNLSPE